MQTGKTFPNEPCAGLRSFSLSGCRKSGLEDHLEPKSAAPHLSGTQFRSMNATGSDNSHRPYRRHLVSGVYSLPLPRIATERLNGRVRLIQERLVVSFRCKQFKNTASNYR